MVRKVRYKVSSPVRYFQVRVYEGGLSAYPLNPDTILPFCLSCPADCYVQLVEFLVQDELACSRLAAWSVPSSSGSFGRMCPTYQRTFHTSQLRRHRDSRDSAYLSPRHLVFQALGKQPSEDDTNSSDGKYHVLGVGEQEVVSFLKPSLEGGEYVVATTQTLTTTNNTPVVKIGEQEFTVMTPKYKVPDNALKSIYPPLGYGAPVETLPHIVFNDPYLPWERDASSLIKPSSVYRVPWLALLTFTADELRLPAQDLAGEGSIFENIQAKPEQPLEQDPNLAVLVDLASIPKLAHCVTPITDTSSSDTDATAANLIFLKPTLFTELFRNNTAGGSDQTYPDLSRYGFLSHSQRINTAGMAEASASDNAYYSLTVSHRVGALAQKGPTTVFVHLVSLEGVEAMTLPIQDSIQYVALASLYSWSYTCLPPDSFDVKDLMRGLGETMGMLRGPQPSAKDIQSNPDRQRVAKRIGDGCTLTRYRTQTGEITAAIYRGALTPVQVPHPISPGWTFNSDCGMDLQILDDELGIVDITYYTAWQLGKTTAIADQSFSTALTKLRSQVHVIAMNRAKAKIMESLGVYRSRSDAVKDTPSILKGLNVLQSVGDVPGAQDQDLLDRWKSTTQDPVDLSLDNHQLEAEYTKKALEAAEELAQSADPDDDYIYNEMNHAKNSEWQLVLSWVLDKMFLSTIPSNYLISDPSHLPPESLRFFHIDPNWMDAFVDGALSVGNHLENRFDKVRTAIKRLINNYLKSPLPVTSRPPQIPTYGFFMRSDIISHFPDLRVSAEYSPTRDNDPHYPSILRQVNVADGVLMCLLDASPYSGVQSRLTGLRFTQPPHQQSFVVGDHLTTSQLHTSFGRIYTAYDGSDKAEPLCDDEVVSNTPGVDSNNTTPPIFLWGPNNEFRTLQFPAWSDNLLQKLQANMPSTKLKTFDSKEATSAIVGIQLTSRICELHITTSESIQSSLTPLGDVRSLWIPPSALHELETQSIQATAARRPITAPLLPPEERQRMPEVATVPASDPPHQNAARAPSAQIKQFADRVMTSEIEDGPAGLPSYALGIFPVGSFVDGGGESRPSAYVPMTRRQDLVFSVTLMNPKLVGTFHIDEIRILVPMGEPQPNRPIYLMRDYHGPGASMLSNLRFNVISSVAPDNSYMLFRLIPRVAKSGGIHFSKAKEISFVLSLVNVNQYEYDQNEGGKQAIITLIQQYKDEFGYDIDPISTRVLTTLKRQ
ncbi:hypothetical protein B0T19DRAFT_396174 [Cercophora scortea]|uniref:Uncharacterized protein n=1 Tax=Cercophora scortea TaxID=314031 RepID=A0AAE0MKX4_9PEZI|nr:hypothetical protein B0T19DRAFT_396174 [Cercophora scortea]